MSLHTWCSLLCRHASFAGAWLLLVLIFAERLIPGSVLPYLNLYWLLVGVAVLTLLAPRTERGGPWRVLWFIPFIVLLGAFFALVVSGMGAWGIFLVGAFVIMVVAVLFAIAYPDTHG